MDVIIKNGLLLIFELKSSIDKTSMYIFERKARFYEKRHQRKADWLIVISPMTDTHTRRVAEQLGIETFIDIAGCAGALTPLTPTPVFSAGSVALGN